MDPACSGWRSAANRNREWIAASRALRVRVLLPRVRSRCSRNAAIMGASRSARSSLDGAVWIWRETKSSSSRKVSR